MGGSGIRFTATTGLADKGRSRCAGPDRERSRDNADTVEIRIPGWAH